MVLEIGMCDYIMFCVLFKHDIDRIDFFETWYFLKIASQEAWILH